MRLYDINESTLNTNHGFKTTSNKYTHINSMDICKQFESLGFEYLGTSSANVRDPEKEGFQKHLMAFTREDLVLSSGERMQILALNSHDASNALKLNLGVYRAACANGLVSGADIHQERIIHIGDIKQDINLKIEEIAARAPQLKSTVDKMKDLTLNFDDAHNLIKSTADIRLKDIKGLVSIDLSTIDRLRRTEDKGQDLWTVFNRCQESMIRGGIQYTRQVVKTNKQGIEYNTTQNASTRSIKEPKRAIELNRELWNSALALVS